MILVNAINLMTAGVCLFCAHLLFLRRQDTEVYLPLALLFSFQSASIGAGVLAQIDDPNGLGPLFRLSVIIGGLELTAPFLFWAYTKGSGH